MHAILGRHLGRHHMARQERGLSRRPVHSLIDSVGSLCSHGSSEANRFASPILPGLVILPSFDQQAIDSGQSELLKYKLSPSPLKPHHPTPQVPVQPMLSIPCDTRRPAWPFPGFLLHSECLIKPRSQRCPFGGPRVLQRFNETRRRRESRETRLFPPPLVAQFLSTSNLAHLTHARDRGVCFPRAYRRDLGAGINRQAAAPWSAVQRGAASAFSGTGELSPSPSPSPSWKHATHGIVGAGNAEGWWGVSLLFCI